METSLDSNILAVIASWTKKAVVLENALVKGLTEGLRQFADHRLISEQLSGRRGNDYGLNVGTGNARNAIDVKMYAAGKDTVGAVTVASRAWYLKVHQHFKFDGYIKPRNSTALAIPISSAARGRSPKDFSGLAFIKRPGKPPLLIRQVKRGKNQKIVREDIMYVLKPRVYIPKRLYFTEEFATFGSDMIKTGILRNLREAKNAN